MAYYRYKAVNRPKPTTCPHCGKKKFSRLLDSMTGKILDERFGLCSSCKYYNYPSKEYAQQHLWADIPHNRTCETSLFGEKIDNINFSMVEKSHRHSGILYDFLMSKFPQQSVDAAWDKYNMGITKNGASIFWEIDSHKTVFTGECILYKTDGKRDKSKDEWWIHNGYENYTLRQVLFGLHLVPDDKCPVIVVESAKNALIGSIAYPDLVWTAVHSKDEFNGKKLYAIRSHPITAIPDVNAVGEWREKADALNKAGYNVKVIDFRDVFSATEDEREQIGAKGDIADLLLLRVDPYELPDVPDLTAIINKNKSVGHLCGKLQLKPSDMTMTLGLIANGTHFADYENPAQVFFHIDFKHGHYARTPQEWMRLYCSTAGFHRPKDTAKFFRELSPSCLKDIGNGMYLFKYDVKWQPLSPSSDGTQRYIIYA